MDTSNMILRTRFADRLCHWLMVICFFLVALSGLSWFFPSLHWLSGVLGTPQLARMLHPFLGVVVFVLLAWMFLRFVRYNLPAATDEIWLRNAASVLANRHDKKLQIGKYNAGQKFLFWGIMASIVLLLASGLVIWRAYFAHLFPIPVIRVALLVHAAVGVALMLLIFGHIYLAIWVRGSIHGMLTGYVSRAWARQHHDRWYDEIVAEERAGARRKP